MNIRRHNHQDIVDEENLPFITDVPERLIGSLAALLAEAELFGDATEIDALERLTHKYLLLRPSKDGSRAAQLVEVLKTQNDDPWDDGMGAREDWGDARANEHRGGRDSLFKTKHRRGLFASRRGMGDE